MPGGAFRSYTPTPFCLICEDRPKEAAHSLAKAVTAGHRSRNTASYLFVAMGQEARSDTTSIYAYLLNEERAVAQDWLANRREWYLGRYMPHREPIGRNTADAATRLNQLVADITEDLRFHLAQLGVKRDP